MGENNPIEEISNPCIFNKKILQATVRPSTARYHMHMRTWSVICDTFLQVIKTCMLHWRSVEVQLTVLAQGPGEKHWLQYNALQIWQGRVNLCWHGGTGAPMAVGSKRRVSNKWWVVMHYLRTFNYLLKKFPGFWIWFFKAPVPTRKNTKLPANIFWNSVPARI